MPRRQQNTLLVYYTFTHVYHDYCTCRNLSGILSCIYPDSCACQDNLISCFRVDPQFYTGYRRPQWRKGVGRWWVVVIQTRNMGHGPSPGFWTWACGGRDLLSYQALQDRQTGPTLCRRRVCVDGRRRQGPQTTPKGWGEKLPTLSSITPPLPLPAGPPRTKRHYFARPVSLGAWSSLPLSVLT